MDTATARRLPLEEHTRHGWKVFEVAPDFELIDAWALPTAGRREEFDELLTVWNRLDPGADAASPATRFLFGLREKLGQWFGWDDGPALPIPGCTERTLHDRLPPDVPGLDPTPNGKTPFVPVFRTTVEYAAEISNSTVHAVVHLAWAARDDDTHQGQLGVFVKPRGWFGRMYMALIAPFRHFIVYPALLRHVGRLWRARMAEL